MKFFGFDSFQGLPEIDKRSVDFEWKFRGGQYSCSYEVVKNNLEKRGVLGKNAFLIKGFYSDSLKNKRELSKYNFHKARIVLIDCDLYESTKDALDFIVNYLQVGTILLFDD